MHNVCDVVTIVIIVQLSITNTFLLEIDIIYIVIA